MTHYLHDVADNLPVKALVARHLPTSTVAYFPTNWPPMIRMCVSSVEIVIRSSGLQFDYVHLWCCGILVVVLMQSCV